MTSTPLVLSSHARIPLFENIFIGTMPALLEFPNEILLAIIKILPHSLDVDGLARTFNRRLYAICMPLLAPRIVYIRNAKAIMAVFGPYEVIVNRHTHMGEGIYYLFDFLGLVHSWGLLTALPPADASDPMRRVEFLDLRGDFYWL
jgi:hypothetical protein